MTVDQLILQLNALKVNGDVTGDTEVFAYGSGDLHPGGAYVHLNRFGDVIIEADVL